LAFISMSIMTGKRILREKKTIDAMIELYCRLEHGKDKQCDDCQHLLNYAKSRLDKCAFQEKKAPCTDCLVHCYKEPERTKVREIMRFSGPKMLSRHPYLAIMHLVDGRRSPGKGGR